MFSSSRSLTVYETEAWQGSQHVCLKKFEFSLMGHGGWTTANLGMWTNPEHQDSSPTVCELGEKTLSLRKSNYRGFITDRQEAMGSCRVVKRILKGRIRLKRPHMLLGEDTDISFPSSELAAGWDAQHEGRLSVLCKTNEHPFKDHFSAYWNHNQKRRMSIWGC